MQREDITGQHNADSNDDGGDKMRLRRITLADGRYMIFYTFDEAHDNRAMETDSQPISSAHAEEEPQDV